MQAAELQLGDQQPQLGDQQLQLGDQQLQLGDQQPQLGDQQPQPGKQQPQLGDQQPQLGDQPQPGEQQPQHDQPTYAHIQSLINRRKSREVRAQYPYPDFDLYRFIEARPEDPAHELVGILKRKALLAHPDKGGSHEMMQNLNTVREWLIMFKDLKIRYHEVS